MNVRKKHFIFDMDGTLSDTGKATAKAIKAVEKRYPLPMIDDSHIRNAMGIGGLDFYRCLYPSVPDDILIKIEPEVDALEHEAVQALGADILFLGVREMLAALVQRGHDLHIASTGSKSHVEGTLHAAGIASFFTSVSSNEPVKIAMVQRIISDSNPQDWAMVGDMFKDSEAARANHILALGAGFGYLAEEDYTLFDAVLRTPGDLLDYCAN